jgi:hypothetical protein
MTDLDRWHELETNNPLTFVGMYQFWAQRTGPNVGHRKRRRWAPGGRRATLLTLEK